MAILVVITLLIGISLSKVEAFNYLGDFCWNFECPTYGSSGKLELGVSHIGGGHYLLSGIAIVTSPEFEQGILYGNAEFIGDNIQLILIHSNSDQNSAWNEIFHCLLDPSTLNGFCKGIDNWTNDKNTDKQVEYIYMILTFVSCQ